jgi:hypothetical protein
MRFFLRYISASFYVLLILLLSWHFLYFNFWRIRYNFGADIWLWGDSQLYQALDQHTWNEDFNVVYAAGHGYGFQDLIAFTHRLPDSAEVILSVGPLFYRYSQDRNTGGLCIDCIESLVKYKQIVDSNYTILSKLRQNMVQEFSRTALFSAKTSVYPDTVRLDLRKSYIDNIQNIIESKDLSINFRFKDSVLNESLNQISNKASKLLFLSLPVSGQLLNSSFTKVNDHYMRMLLSAKSDFDLDYDTLHIRVLKDPFYDATHLNESITKLLNEKIKTYFQSMSRNTILVIDLEGNSTE